jgi:LysM repeat protein
VLVALACLPAVSWADDPATTAPPPPTYVVKAGDSLWTIARDILGNPFLWRALLDANPFVKQANRIYPGDTLVLPGPGAPAEAEAPPPVAAAPAEAPSAAEAAAATEPPTPAEEPTPAAPQPPQVPKLVDVPAAPVPAASPHAVACTPVVTEEVAAAQIGVGSLVQSEDHRVMLSGEDNVFIGLTGDARAAVGDRFAVVRMAKRVAHPVTGAIVGRVMETLGIVEVREARGATLKGRVVYACMPMELGDRVVPFSLSPLPAQPAVTAATRALEGVVISAAYSREFLVQQHVIFLDVGSTSGVRQGDVFAVYRPNLPARDLATGAMYAIPPSRLGEAVVTRVTPGTASAVVTVSQKESHPGDRAVLSRQVEP